MHLIARYSSDGLVGPVLNQGNGRTASFPQKKSPALKKPNRDSVLQEIETTDHTFEYDDQFRVTLENTNAFGSYGFSYTTNPNGQSADNFNYWNVKTVETLPDGNQNIVYTNFQKQAMLSVFHDVSASAKWITYSQFNDKGYVTLKALPSALSGYDDTYNDLVEWDFGNATYIKDGEGLVLTNTYASSTTATSTSAGDAKGWPSSSNLSRGETGTAVPQSAISYIKVSVKRTAF